MDYAFSCPHYQKSPKLIELCSKTSASATLANWHRLGLPSNLCVVWLLRVFYFINRKTHTSQQATHMILFSNGMATIQWRSNDDLQNPRLWMALIFYLQILIEFCKFNISFFSMKPRPWVSPAQQQVKLLTSLELKIVKIFLFLRRMVEINEGNVVYLKIKFQSTAFLKMMDVRCLN